MILRKPYAILIKYFKIIHIILFLIFTYLVFEIRNIYLFFVNYVKNDNFTYFENMANKYMNPIIFIMIILIIAFAISVYLLMRKKEKPVLFYKILIIYGAVLLIFWIYFRYFFSTLDEISYETLTIIVFRDITAFIYYVNFFYVGFAFIRGFGFDIKKFSFDKDKKELNIEETDSEEYELNIGLDRDNVANYINREKREFKYYLKENKEILIIVTVVLIIFGGLYLYFNRYVENKIYNEKEDILLNNIAYRINQSTITKLDKNSNIISNSNSFIIVNMDVTNLGEDNTIEKENYRIKINNDYYYPVLNYNSQFDDVGAIYNEKNLLKNNITTNLNFLYKINDTDIQESYFEIYNGNGDYPFEKIILNLVDQTQENINQKIEDTIEIKDEQIKFTNYSIKDKASYDYEKCNGDKCNKYVKMVVPKLNYNVLILELDHLNNNILRYIEDYLAIEYTFSGNIREISSKDISIITSNNNTVYLNVSKIVNNNINSFIIKTRDKNYKISVGENNE